MSNHKTPPNFDDLTGKHFGRLLVKGRVENRKRKWVTLWQCECSCGRVVNVERPNLQSGRQVSCGCYRDEKCSEAKTTHGHTKNGADSPTYSTWLNMVTRCTNPKSNRWQYYGGRGIKVCDRWLHSFENFLEDMGERPPNMTIERKDNDGNYCKANCVWATAFEQGKNRSNNRLLDVNGEVRTVAEWARISGLNEETLRNRIDAGWLAGRCLRPIGHGHKRNEKVKSLRV